MISEMISNNIFLYENFRFNFVNDIKKSGQLVRKHCYITAVTLNMGYQCFPLIIE